MGNDKEAAKGSVAAGVAAAVIVAVLTGGTAPWWWDRVFGGSAPPQNAVSQAPSDGASSPPSSPPSSAGSGPGGSGAGGSTEPASGCTVAVSGVAQLLAKPEPASSGGSIPEGMYRVIRTAHVLFAGRTPLYYEISVQGHQGWVENNPAEIESTSDACPKN